MNELLSALSSFCMHNLLYALSAFYMDSPYFTFTLRITAVLYKHATLHIPSTLTPCTMISLMVQYQNVFRIKCSSAVRHTSRSEFNSWCVIGIFPSHKFLLIGAEALGSARNKFQKYFLGGKGDRCVGLTALPSSCAAVLKSKSPGI